MIRRALIRAAGNPLLGSILGLVEKSGGRRGNLLRGLTYHDIDDAAIFEKQMRLVAEEYHPVSGTEVIAALEGGPELPPRAVLVTFDDAYRSFGAIAWPVLRRLSIPAVLFVPTSFPDQPSVFWWERLEHAFLRTERRTPLASSAGNLDLSTPDGRRAALVRMKKEVKSLPYAEAMQLVDATCTELGATPLESPVLGWDELRALAREGLELGAHTRTHPFLDCLRLDEAEAEIRGSIEDLEREIGVRPTLFAYPDGRYTTELAAGLGSLGLKAAFTTQRGTNDLESVDPLRIRRIHVGAHDTAPILRARLAWSARPLNRWRHLLDGHAGEPVR